MALSGVEVTEAELLKAIAEAPSDAQGEGMTTNELIQATGMGRDRAMRLIRQGLATGQLRRSKKLYCKADGVWYPAVSWVAVKKGEP